VAVRVREAVQNPDCDANEVARLIQTDPVLAARLVQAANSPLYGVQTPIYSCKGAVMFLGLGTTRDLVLAYTLRELFHTQSPLLRRRMRALWQHSVLVGAVSYVLAGMTPGLDKDRALLAGLLHDIGAVPVVDYAGREPALAQDGALLDAAIAALRGQVGAMVLRQWKFGNETVNIALEAEDWQRDPVAQAEYTDVIVIAQQLLLTEQTPDHLAEVVQLPAWNKLARGRLDQTLATEILREARSDVADVLQLLN
jgi:HD-like signal output (HDOD) protein